MPQRMTLRDVQLALRERGMRISQATISDSLKSGVFPFGSAIATGVTGRTTFMIFRSDFEKWADEKLPRVKEPA